MPKYVALIVGEGEGCDYTMGCNKKWEFVEADGIEACRTKILKKNGMLDFDSDYIPHILIEYLQIIEISGESVKYDNPDKWFMHQYEVEKEKKKNHSEYEMYLQLKNKFEE